MNHDIEGTLNALALWEGLIEWLYLDTRGLVTVGIGNLVPSENAAMGLQMHVDERPATEEELVAAYRAVALCPPGLRAGRYQGASRLRMTEHAARTLAENRLVEEFWPGLRRMFPGFDDFPAGPRMALTSMAWALGLKGLGKFSHLRAAIAKPNWIEAADMCHMKGARESRNNWHRDLFVQGARL